MYPLRSSSLFKLHKDNHLVSKKEKVIRFYSHTDLDLFVTSTINEFPLLCQSVDYNLLCNFDNLFRMRSEANDDDLLSASGSRWDKDDDSVCPFEP